MSRCFFKEITSIDFLFPMYQVLPISSKKVPVNVTCHIDYTANKIKITKKSRRSIISSFLPGYIRFYGLI